MQKKLLRKSNFLKLLSELGDEQMPTSSVDKKLKKKKKNKEETSGKIALRIRFVSFCLL
jgi:hypothetical protein